MASDERRAGPLPKRSSPAGAPSPHEVERSRTAHPAGRRDVVAAVSASRISGPGLYYVEWELSPADSLSSPPRASEREGRR
jgi:hypothetical protein